MSIRRLSTQRIGGSPSVYIGHKGEIFYDPAATGPLRISDGITPGGNDIVNGGIGPGTVFDADLIGNVTGDVLGNLTGNVLGNVTGRLTGNVLGNLTGNVLGNVTGNLTGSVTGNLTGNVVGNVTGNLTGNVLGNVTGNVLGNVTGRLTGNVVGNVTGNLTGNVLGNVTGNVLGNLTGNIVVGGNTWAFGSAGTLTFPDSTVQNTAFTGLGTFIIETIDGAASLITTQEDGFPYGHDIVIAPSGEGAGISIPNYANAILGQSLSIDGTANSNVTISTEGGTWRFNTSGNLVLPVDKYVTYPDGTIYGGSGSGTVNIEIDGGFPSSIFDETSLVIDGGVV